MKVSEKWNELSAQQKEQWRTKHIDMLSKNQGENKDLDDMIDFNQIKESLMKEDLNQDYSKQLEAAVEIINEIHDSQMKYEQKQDNPSNKEEKYFKDMMEEIGEVVEVAERELIEYTDEIGQIEQKIQIDENVENDLISKITQAEKKTPDDNMDQQIVDQTLLIKQLP